MVLGPASRPAAVVLQRASGPSQSRASAAGNCCATCIGAERNR